MNVCADPFNDSRNITSKNNRKVETDILSHVALDGIPVERVDAGSMNADEYLAVADRR
jgi:hypothetical protein